MCGIAGIVRFDGRPIDPRRLEAMLRQVRHRGPDGEAILSCGRAALAHARLSIIDHVGGAQPMSAAATDRFGPVTVVFNGMIYNHRALRGELEVRGHRFSSDHSDTEVLLHGYRQWGHELPTKLDGFFAFAIWDEREQALLAARDRMGKKPLYFCRGDNEISFASLIAALVAGSAGASPVKISHDALRTYLRLGYTFEQSLIDGIEEIPAAHRLMIDSRGGSRLESYWSPPAWESSSGDDHAPTFHEMLSDAVSRRLEADVPLGCFLSGGIDSSVVAAMAQQELKARGGESLQTFSVRMPELEYDESAYAQITADHIGTRHIVVETAPRADFMSTLSHLIRQTGEPTADSSLLPTYWVSRAARQHVKVVLSGDGGDEWFAGYDRYHALRVLDRHGWWLRHVPASLTPPDGRRPDSTRNRLHRLFHAARGRTPAARYRSMVHLFREEEISRLCPGIECEGVDMPRWPDCDDGVLAAMIWDRSHYLPFDILRKVDRAAMPNALEVRCPLLDTLLVKWAGRISSRALMHDKRLKGLLRQVAEKLLPDAIVQRRKKGFSVPIGRWFRDELRQPLSERLFDGGLTRLGLKRAPIDRMFEQHIHCQADHSHRLFALLTLSIWQDWLATTSKAQATE